MFLRLVFFLLAHLPLKLRRWLATAIAVLIQPFIKRRLAIAKTNLSLCFPHWTEKQKKQTLKKNLKLSVQTLLDRAWLWQGSATSLKKRLTLTGQEHLHTKGSIIVLCPHFLSIDAAGTRLSMERQMGCFYRAAKNKTFNHLMKKGRARFNQTDIHEKSKGLKVILHMLTNQTPVFYTSDQDHGIASASFVPFFNIPAATVNVLPKLIRKYQATLLLCLPQITPKGYEIKIEKDQQITNLSQENEDEKALIAMNKWFEEVITQNPEQYLWMHRRFKTRPKNIPNVYTAF